MQQQTRSCDVVSGKAPSRAPLDGMKTVWMPDISGRPTHSAARAGQDLRLQMLAFVRGAEHAEHAGRLAERLDTIIALTRQLCSQRIRSRRSVASSHATPASGPPRIRLSPAVARILGQLDEVRGALENMEAPHPMVRHALDPLLIAFLRGEVGGARS
jgi:hypothetical protein